jgi:hypothetical protein
VATEALASKQEKRKRTEEEDYSEIRLSFQGRDQRKGAEKKEIR